MEPTCPYPITKLQRRARSKQTAGVYARIRQEIQKNHPELIGNNFHSDQGAAQARSHTPALQKSSPSLTESELRRASHKDLAVPRRICNQAVMRAKSWVRCPLQSRPTGNTQEWNRSRRATRDFPARKLAAAPSWRFVFLLQA